MPWQDPKTNWKAGDSPSSSDLNRIEENIKIVDESVDSHVLNIDPHGKFNQTTDMVYTGEKLTRVDEKIGGVLRKRTAFTYTGESLTNVNTQIYAENGITLISEYNDVLSYVGSSLSNVQRMVVL